MLLTGLSVYSYLSISSRIASSSRRTLLSVLAAFLPPTIAIVQGTLRIFIYRAKYGDSPVPRAPSHGVVIVHPQDKSRNEKLEHKVTNLPQRISLGCECYEHQSSCDHSRFLQKVVTQQQKQQQPPLRLLVIGDSLAIGVGQSKSCAPIMPEVIAKSLSKKLGGRVVYWTCHGAPGASTGWIVRELERGVNYLRTPPEQDSSYNSDKLHSDSSTLSETDDSSSESSSGYSSFASKTSGYVKGDKALKQHEEEEIKHWRRKLEQHRKRFDPEPLGPYDIAVVLTGSNDLKAACFPFLLTGEDAEFRRQAKARGGYSIELRRLLSTLNSRLRMKLQMFYESVEAVSDTVIERVEGIISGSRCSTHSVHHHHYLNNRDNALTREDALTKNSPVDGDTTKMSTGLPLVVLPGMPSRVLPIFEAKPLRWLSVPIVDIMDMQKRQLAADHPGELLFVPPPSVRDLSLYVDQNSELWNERVEEDVVLAVRDVRRSSCRRIQGDMDSYYAKRGSASGSADGPLPHHAAFSVDGVHPNQLGYDFWGRYIANAIHEEWKKQHC